jgi:hypothetical protein
MVIYIAGLLLLIAVILLAVYKRVDSFQSSLISNTSTVQDLLDENKKLIKKVTNQKEQLDTNEEFDDVLSKAKLDELGVQYEVKNDVVTLVVKPISKALSSSSQELLDILTPLETEYKKLNPTLKLKDFFPKQEDITNMNSGLQFFKTLLDARETYITSKVGTKEAPVDMEELYGAVKSTEIEEDDMTNIVGKAPQMSTTSTKEMEERIAKSVATQLKDSLLAKRATQDIVNEMPCPYASLPSDATAQGGEFTQAKPSPTPDMSEYIRKDSIPCWNCSLP